MLLAVAGGLRAAGVVVLELQLLGHAPFGCLEDEPTSLAAPAQTLEAVRVSRLREAQPRLVVAVEVEAEVERPDRLFSVVADLHVEAEEAHARTRSPEPGDVAPLAHRNLVVEPDQRYTQSACGERVTRLAALRRRVQPAAGERKGRHQRGQGPPHLA